MSKTQSVTLEDLNGTIGALDTWLDRYRQQLAKTMTPEQFAALEGEIEHDDEAAELMVREPKVEPDEDDLRDVARFARNTEPQDNILSGAVNSER
jgi:hypothetical protein